MGKLDFIPKLPAHISHRLSNKCVVIEKTSDISGAIDLLQRQAVIGVSLEGSDISRHGILEWLSVSSSCGTYLFNIISLQKHAFNGNLQALLENPHIVKVFHDCRRAADCLYHQYNTKLSKVFDTQVADYFVNAMEKNLQLITNKVNSLNYCLEHYLNVPKKYLFESSCATSSNSCFKNSQDVFIKNVIYLRLLRQKLNVILQTPFRRCVDVYLQSILRKSDQELKLNYPDLRVIPQELVYDNMQKLQFTEQFKPQIAPREKKGDPYTRYAKDCKKYQTFKHNNVPDEKLQRICSENGLWYSDRRDIIQFLLDRMYAGDRDDVSIVTMTPFEEKLDDLDCLSISSKSQGFEINPQSESPENNEGNHLIVPNCTSGSSNLCDGNNPPGKNENFQELYETENSTISAKDSELKVRDSNECSTINFVEVNASQGNEGKKSSFDNFGESGSSFTPLKDLRSADIDLCNTHRAPNVENLTLLETTDGASAEDPWAKLREAFSEHGSVPNSKTNVKFIPAGMQL